MNPLRRYEIIMEALLAQQEVTVNELSEQLEVTGKTIREDLAKLEEKGLLVRIHGGAMLAQSDQHGILSSKEPIIKHADEKVEIAELALKHIQPRDIIALDGGSTTLEIARRLENQPLTVVTNDVYIISELVRKDEIRLVVPGGTRIRNMLAGPEASEYVSKLNIQKSFISATGVHLQYGFTIYTSELVEYKRALINSSHTVYGVVDHYKFGQCALRTFAELSEISMIITDRQLPSETAEQFRDKGIQLEYE
ncbi:DeoR/GlpR family DNA-binding transcription regulator [Paenibacillus hexagrammi]|uniref:DeoR/GlpR family DNA-binding transcription regulator n=1 Tax=Paenibacillus hexagrammi TaxID=2908839 RepID=A0ABY3SLQ4_9BACL|nr:DeoR/GlpR family DNA-binding transcription regulator [Paenibacillus sp. YPD9-1]UJF34988.1 DeoR/GlpR family DNA-binding transcription regulator [Paenibacillus sp. YPD9-1]